MAKQTTPHQPQKLAENQTLNGSNTLPALIEITSALSVQLGAIVMSAFEASGLTADAWNALTETERDGLLNAAIDAMKAAEKVKAEADAKKAQEEADAKTAALQARQPAFGPRAKQEIRYGGKTYAPGERLPADVDEDTLDELDELDAI